MPYRLNPRWRHRDRLGHRRERWAVREFCISRFLTLSCNSTRPTSAHECEFHPTFAILIERSKRCVTEFLKNY